MRMCLDGSHWNLLVQSSALKLPAGSGLKFEILPLNCRSMSRKEFQISSLTPALLLGRAEEWQLCCKIEPAFLYFDVIGDRLLRKIGQRGRRRILIEIQPIFYRFNNLSILLCGEVKPLCASFHKSFQPLACVIRHRAIKIGRGCAKSFPDRVIELPALLRCNFCPALLRLDDSFDTLASPVGQRGRWSTSVEFHSFVDCLENQGVLLSR